MSYIARLNVVTLVAICLVLGLAFPVSAWWYTSSGGSTGQLRFGRAFSLAVAPSGDVVATGHGISGIGGLVTVKLSATTGVELWRQELQDGFGLAVAVDASGDTIAAGFVYNGSVGPEFLVVKLSGQTGVEQWRSQFGGPVVGKVHAVALDASSDVVVAGRATGFPNNKFFVAKLSGQTGAELWRHETDNGTAFSVTVDASGDVVAAGFFDNGTSSNFAVIKVSGATGTELWRQELGGTGTFSAARSAIVDPTGDVVVVGDRNDPGAKHFAVVKFSGTTGNELWRQELSGTDATSVAMDTSGDIVAAGSLDNAGIGNFAVVKFAGGTGTELWRQQPSTGLATSVTVDASGDVAAAGAFGTFAVDTSLDFAMVKLSGATGTELWRQQLNGVVGNADVANSVAVDDMGNVLAAGTLDNHHVANLVGDDFTVVSVSAATGQLLLPKTGNSLIVGDDATNPTRRKIRVRSKDRLLPVTGAMGNGDPTVTGAQLRITNPSTGETATFSLPAVHWQAHGKRIGPLQILRYDYKDSKGVDGPCQRVRVSANRKLFAKCSGKLGDIPFTLDEATQGELAVALSLGSVEYCMRFGGTIEKDRGTNTSSSKGVFKAKRAPASPIPCP